MKVRIATLALTALTLAGCPKMLHNGGGWVLFEGDLDRGGESAELHPAVIEYLFAAPDSPIRRYYDARLAAEQPPTSLEHEAAALAGAGQPVGGEHYARAKARQLAAAINEGLTINDTGVGTLDVRCCKEVDRDSGKLTNAILQVALVVNRTGQFMRLTHPREERTWDLQYVKGAFDARAPLDYQTVAQMAIPLHDQKAAR